MSAILLYTKLCVSYVLSQDLDTELVAQQSFWNHVLFALHDRLGRYMPKVVIRVFKSANTVAL